MEKFKPMGHLKIKGDFVVKKLRGGWPLHDSNNLNRKPASLPERTQGGIIQLRRAFLNLEQTSKTGLAKWTKG
jgi:hypothetical protein